MLRVDCALSVSTTRRAPSKTDREQRSVRHVLAFVRLYEVRTEVFRDFVVCVWAVAERRDAAGVVSGVKRCREGLA